MVHEFDNKLEETIKNLSLLTEIRIIPVDIKLQSFRQLEKIITDNIAKNFFNMILNDLQKNVNQNYDPINKLYAEDLLYIIYLHLEKIKLEPNLKEREDKQKTMIELLNEQLSDMRTGSCPQGRTIRLLQIVISIN